MSFDVLGSLNSVLGGPLTRQVSSLLGESEDSTQSAVRAAVPSLLAGLMQQVTTPAGAADVFRIVNDDRVDSNIASKLGSLVGNRGAFDSLLSNGASFLGSLFGSRSNAVASALSEISGVRPDSAKSLLSLGLPLLLGVLRKQATSGGLTPSGLASLLFSQRNALEKTGLDGRITNALGLGNLQSFFGGIPTGAAARAEPARAIEPVREPVKRNRAWLPWAIAAGVAALAFLLFYRAGDDSRPATPQTATAATRVYFETGQTAIDNTDRIKIASVAQSAKQQDRAVTVTGYTDRTGDMNQNREIAKNRAEAVRDALIAEGVGATQIMLDPPVQPTGAGTDAEARRVDIELR